MPDQTAREFDLGAILTVATGIVLAPVADVHELLDYMTGDQLFTHQLPRAMGECAPELLRQHPDLAAVDVPEFDGEASVLRWLDGQVARFGPRRAVTPLREGDHTRIDPIAELKMHWPDVPVAVLEVPDGH